jgi:uncharacterized protein (DUF2249 family)
MNSKITVLDVREDFRSGQRPCDKIKTALSKVVAGETLRLLVPFEPAPLYQLAANEGLGHESKQTTGGDWEVMFSHELAIAGGSENDTASAHAGCGCGGSSRAENIDVDARGLEPPQPMVRILEALGNLATGGTLRARTDRRPVHLYGQLEDRGFAAQSEEQSDGSFLTNIRRA